LALTFFAHIFCILPKEFPLLNKLHLKIPANLQSFNISRKKTSWMEIEEENEEICEFN